MAAKSFALLLADLGITRSLNRPYVSNDNPFSEAQFKTTKYDPSYPRQFGTLEEARIWCRPFFDSYNNFHHHSGLGWMTPANVHFGSVDQVNSERSRALDAAYAATQSDSYASVRPRQRSQPRSGSIHRLHEIDSVKSDKECLKFVDNFRGFCQ